VILISLLFIQVSKLFLSIFRVLTKQLFEFMIS